MPFRTKGVPRPRTAATVAGSTHSGLTIGPVTEKIDATSTESIGAKEIEIDID